jgi:hypothetical protein
MSKGRLVHFLVSQGGGVFWTNKALERVPREIRTAHGLITGRVTSMGNQFQTLLPHGSGTVCCR